MSSRLWLAVVVALALPAAGHAQGTPIFLLRVTRSAGAGARAGVFHGNGFVVRDWRNDDPDARLLVTAAHVLESAVSAEVLDVDCQAVNPATYRQSVWVVPKNAEIVVWPSYDMAAIPFKASKAEPAFAAALKRKGDQGAVAFGAKVPAKGARVALDATSQLSACQSGFGDVKAYPTACAVATFLAERFGRTLQSGKCDLGSIPGQAALVEYKSTAAPGASGAAVTSENDRRQVLGLHFAGFEGRDVGWGVLLVGLRDRLEADASSQSLGDRTWRRYQPPWFAQATEQVPKEIRDEAKPMAPGRQYFGVAAFGERGLTGTPFGWSLGAVVDAVLERDPGEDVDVALGLRFKLGYRAAIFRDRYLAPDGTQLFASDRTVHGALVGASPELRFARLSLWRPAVGAGVRGWITGTADWAVGVPVHARLDATISGQWSATAETWLVAEWGAGSVRRFTGVGGTTRGPGRAWGLAWGLALGIEY